MLAYKFLDHHGRAPFTGMRWRPGEWIEAAGAAPCRDGVHGCEASDVAYWLAAAMWTVELEGQIVRSRHKIAASRGRLVAPVAGYDDALHELREIGAWQSRDLAVAALRAAGDTELAATFEAVASMRALADLGERCDDSTFAGRAAALASDAARFGLDGAVAQGPFVAACAAAHHATGPDGEQAAFDEAYRLARAAQSAWLGDRLGLA